MFFKTPILNIALQRVLHDVGSYFTSVFPDPLLRGPAVGPQGQNWETLLHRPTSHLLRETALRYYYQLLISHEFK